MEWGSGLVRLSGLFAKPPAARYILMDITGSLLMIEAGSFARPLVFWGPPTIMDAKSAKSRRRGGA